MHPIIETEPSQPHSSLNPMQASMAWSTDLAPARRSRTRSVLGFGAALLCLCSSAAGAPKKDVFDPNGPVIILDPVDPATEPPVPPSGVLIGERAATSVPLSFQDSSAYEDGYRLERRLPGQGWQTVRSFGVQTGGVQHTDTGLTPDTEYCYRVAAFNSHGTRLSSERCLYTRDGNDYRVWRAQLVVRTTDRSDANTDDSVSVSLNGSSVPSGNLTWLDYGRDDFERGTEYTYDLNLDAIDDMSDITRINLTKEGDDGLCISGLALKVNGIEVFNQDFGAAANCKVLDSDSGHSRTHSVSHDELRAHPAWSSYNHDAALFALAFGIPNAELESRVESMVGHGLHDTELHWGHIYGDAVEVTRGCPAGVEPCTTAHVDLDLAKDSWLPDPEVDVDFDLDFVCSDGALTITTSNLEVDADSEWYWELLSIGFIEIFDYKVAKGVTEAWTALEETLDVGADCRVTVSDEGGLFIEAVPRQTPPPGPGGGIFDTVFEADGLDLSVRNPRVAEPVILEQLSREPRALESLRESAPPVAPKGRKLVP